MFGITHYININYRYLHQSQFHQINVSNIFRKRKDGKIIDEQILIVLKMLLIISHCSDNNVQISLIMLLNCVCLYYSMLLCVCYGQLYLQVGINPHYSSIFK